jgi:hypothetical protein
MPKPPLTLRRAVAVAEMAMVLQRRTYAFDRNLYVRGVHSPHTERSYEKYEQLTEAISLLKSLVAPLPPAAAPGDTKLSS